MTNDASYTRSDSSASFQDNDRKHTGNNVPQIASDDVSTLFFQLPNSVRKAIGEEASRRERSSSEQAEPVDGFTQLLRSVSKKKTEPPRFTSIQSSQERELQKPGESAGAISGSGFKATEVRDREVIAQVATTQVGAESKAKREHSGKPQGGIYRLLLCLVSLNLCATVLLLALTAYILFHFRESC